MIATAVLQYAVKVLEQKDKLIAQDMGNELNAASRISDESDIPVSDILREMNKVAYRDLVYPYIYQQVTESEALSMSEDDIESYVYEPLED
jgi:hypothetical protein